MFLGVSRAGEGNLFFITYPAMLCSLIPVTLQTYDERGKWDAYVGTLPVTRARLVSSKYLVGLCCSGIVLALLALVLLAANRYTPELRLFLLGITFCLSLVSPAFCLPFVFRFGTEKGRMAYYFSIGLFFAASYILADSLGISAADTSAITSWNRAAAAPGLLAACRIYQKREIA